MICKNVCILSLFPSPHLYNSVPDGRRTLGIFIILALFRCRTIALETGFQNAQLCSTIVQLSFSFKELELMFAFPLIYSIFQMVVAIIFVGGKSPMEFSLFNMFRYTFS